MTIHKSITRTLLLTGAGLGLTLTSCGYVNESLPECPEPSALELQFTHFKNMAYADGFQRNVHCLGVYIFDENEKLVKVMSEPDDTYLVDPDYKMYTEMPAGKYTVLAYGGMECNESDFYHTFNSNKTDLTMNDFFVELKLDSENHVGHSLHKQFYGRQDVVVNETGTTHAVVDMMRNTNDIQVALMHISMTEINADDFVFELVDDNNSINPHNQLIETGEILYTPWRQRTQMADLSPDFGSKAGEDEDNNYQGIAAMATFSVSKLETSRHPTLRVSRADDGTEVFKVDLSGYLKMFMAEHEGINGTESLQDYLDRENHWQLMFFLDDQTDVWLNTYIQIQDWFTRINGMDF